ncbi:Uu.00g039080.m01.CDS01 [Anthostomella pinea]|uniref:Uu.00g039080.m01.CDS01 n=1 Tax=Anthostomella pinea TaxID=933095 RepID=A0AAI8VAX2_9PEZI|nr:Uu.00g039080.m01.CDS01 [Anthostomella pinea]
MCERMHNEMRQKSRLHDPFFGLKGLEPRPTSIATEIVDTDWDEEDMVSEIEEDDDINSPRVSLNSSGQQSATTLSSYDEAHTPRSSRTREAYPFEYEPAKPVEGPRGPHLFRSSTTSSSNSFYYQEALSLSPITPKTARPYECDLRYPLTYDPLPRSRTSPYQFTHEKLEPTELAMWSPHKVAQWMLNAGIELPAAEKFVENDINGAILITLKFEDLRELHIQSFGVRTKVWEEIHVLRDRKEMSPRPDTPIEDEESKEVRRERRRVEKEETGEFERCPSLKRSKSLKRSQSRRKPSHEDIISPMESVSIVGIEQMMPKPHHCSKGENCSKYRRQQRMIEAFKKDHPFVDTDQGGIIMVAGNPGNPETAPAINRPSSTEALRPFSEAVPSVVASSDVLGPGIPALQYLQEAALRNLQTQDPQDNVRQFLDFQHQQPDESGCSSEAPPTPHFEVYPGVQAPHERLRALPKLAIPGQQQHAQRQSSQQPGPSNLRNSFVPYRMDRAEALSPDLQTPVGPYRFGTPFSDMDIPLTAVPLGPIARDASQSVPPDMGYHAAPVNRINPSRASHRPSLQIMAPVVEDDASTTPIARTTPKPPSPSLALRFSPPPRVPTRPQHPLQAPPRAQYPWSSAAQALQAQPNAVVAEGVAYQGPVKKRKTRMLRHEWHDQYAVLKGTQLALHKDAAAAGARERSLEYIDIDDYAIACSSLNSTSRLNAAFKAMSISRSKQAGVSADDSVAAFSFQLIPQDLQGVGARLRNHRRESRSIGSGPLTGGLEGGFNGTGKTHHFAVKSRDERIDWMRELMLAKALKQKGEGFEVSVNGNMI